MRENKKSLKLLCSLNTCEHVDEENCTEAPDHSVQRRESVQSIIHMMLKDQKKVPCVLDGFTAGEMMQCEGDVMLLVHVCVDSGDPSVLRSSFQEVGLVSGSLMSSEV